MKCHGLATAAVFIFVIFIAGCVIHSDSDWDYIVNAGIWLSPQGDLFIAGYSGVEKGFVKKLQGGAFETIYETDTGFLGIGGSDSADLFAVGGSYPHISHFDGQNWEAWDLSEDLGEEWSEGALKGVWGGASNDVFAVGFGGLIAHYDGSVWTRMESGTSADLEEIWGSASDDVYAVGEGGAILHFDGEAWSQMVSGTTGYLNDVWGSSPTDIWAVGEVELEKDHVILHYDGVEWSVVRTGEGGLLGVHGAAANDIYAVGGLRNEDDSVKGVALHYDGTSWTEIDAGVNMFLWDVAVTAPGGDCYMVGPDDTIVHL